MRLIISVEENDIIEKDWVFTNQEVEVILNLLNLKELLRDTVRNCDEFVELESGAAVLMSETDSEDALIAVERYKCRCAEQVDLRIAVASYPADGRGTVELLEILQRRLNQAEAIGNGAVVAKG